MPSHFPPRSPPTGTETTAQAPQEFGQVFTHLIIIIIFFLTFTCTESGHYAQLIGRIWQEREQLAFYAKLCGGDGAETVSLTYNQVKSLWLKCCYRKGRARAKLRHAREVTNLPVLCQIHTTELLRKDCQTQTKL